jgi:hypothetical protein
MHAWKFLREGAVERFSGERWPAPGRWREGPADACREDDLPLWIAPELWAVELRDPVAETPVKVAAGAARLVERVATWDAAAAEAFTRAAVERVRSLGLPDYARDAEAYCLDEADPFRAAALGSLIAIHAAERAGGELAVRRERHAQTGFFRDNVLG